jgi:hypothetical protein
VRGRREWEENRSGMGERRGAKWSGGEGKERERDRGRIERERDREERYREGEI